MDIGTGRYNPFRWKNKTFPVHLIILLCKRWHLLLRKVPCYATKDGIFCCERCHVMLQKMASFDVKDAIFCMRILREEPERNILSYYKLTLCLYTLTFAVNPLQGCHISSFHIRCVETDSIRCSRNIRIPIKRVAEIGNT